MRYLLLIYGTGERGAPGSPEAAAVATAHRRFRALCEERGAFLAADPLFPPDTAVTVRPEGLVTDGPFAETKEWLAGYYLLECDHQTAVELAGHLTHSCLENTSIEVRPVIDVDWGPPPVLLGEADVP